MTARPSAADHGDSPNRRLVVLIVDDEQVTRDSLLRLLGECDFATIAAGTGLHALQILKERHVDAIVADQVMPGLDGIALLDSVAKSYPACTRLLCTGYPGSLAVRQALDQGRLHRVLPKTMHAVAMRDEIERAVLQGRSTVSAGRA